MGAIVNCALAIHFSTTSADHVLQQVVGHPLSALRSLLVLPAALGFLIGTVILLVWTFIRALVIRFLLDYNGWFLHSKRQINKVSSLSLRKAQRVHCVHGCFFVRAGVVRADAGFARQEEPRFGKLPAIPAFASNPFPKSYL